MFLYAFGLARLSAVAISPPIEPEVVVDTELLSKLTLFHRVASIVSDRTLLHTIKYCDTNSDHKEYVEFWYCPGMSQMRTLIGIISSLSAIPMGSAHGFSCTGVVKFSFLITGNCIDCQLGRNLVSLPRQSHGNSSCRSELYTPQNGQFFSFKTLRFNRCTSSSSFTHCGDSGIGMDN